MATCSWAGSGSGFIADDLAKRDEVDSVTVVEISKEVVGLVQPYLHNAGAKICVERGDIFKHLVWAREHNETYDCAFYDIWQSDGEETFFKTVIPLLVESDSIVTGMVSCWNLGVMAGQLTLALVSRALFAVSDDPQMYHQDLSLDALSEEVHANDCTDVFWNWSVPFFRMIKSKGIGADGLRAVAAEYVHHYIGRAVAGHWPPGTGPGDRPSS